jgi:hypothetical protein
MGGVGAVAAAVIVRLFKLTPEKEGIAGAAVTLRGWSTIGGVTLFIFPGTTFSTTVTSAVRPRN